MNNKGIPQAVSEFIDKYIRSIGELEVLLFLKENSGQEYGASEIGKEFRSNREMATQQLEELFSKGLIQRKGNSPPLYSYSPRKRELDLVLKELQEAYHQKRFTITNYIYDRPMDRILGFAKAFQLKKDE